MYRLKCTNGYVGIGSKSFTISVEKDEDPSGILTRLMRRFEYITGVRLDMERLLFADSEMQPLMGEDEIVSQAIRHRVIVGIIPRSGHSHNDHWSFEDVVPTVIMHVGRNGFHFPLITRFRIWTFIWGTARSIKKLIDANSNFLEKALSVGISEETFNDILNAPIPSTPAIGDDAGLDLMVRLT